MHTRDDTPLYDLPEAGLRLLRDPVWLAREARLRRIPSIRVAGATLLSARWVDAEAGTSSEDPVPLAKRWLERHAPPRPGAHRVKRDRAALGLPDEELLTAEAACTQLCADAAALERLDASGELPSLVVDGERHYDAGLVALLDERAQGETLTPGDLEGRVIRRQEEVLRWARFAYLTAPGGPPPSTAGSPETPPPVAAEGAAEPATHDDTPGAFRIPDELELEGIEPMPPPLPRIAEAEGYDMIEED